MLPRMQAGERLIALEVQTEIIQHPRPQCGCRDRRSRRSSVTQTLRNHAFVLRRDGVEAAFVFATVHSRNPAIAPIG